MPGEQGGRCRLDLCLTRLGLAASRQVAQRLIMAGLVLVDDRPAVKPGQLVALGAVVRVKERDFPWVSRGGVKLAHALEEFHLSPEGAVCLDVGAATGGFTDVLLTGGATRVYAVDVGYGQLAWKLSQDPRVVVRERTNLRALTAELLPEPIDLLVIDVSFISLTLALPAVSRFMRLDGLGGVALIKPQFEVGRERVGKGGVVRDPEGHALAIATVLRTLDALGFRVDHPVIPSPLLGPAGNREFLVYFTPRPSSHGTDST